MLEKRAKAESDLRQKLWAEYKPQIFVTASTD
jgi:hypothetical protein